MLGYKLLYLASLITFTFGALTFSVLALFYWRERRLRRNPGSGPVFAVLTLVCASAFLVNLLLQAAAALDAPPAVVTSLSLALGLITGLLPPLLFHLIYYEERHELPWRRAWRWVLALMYTVGVAAAVWKGLQDWDWIPLAQDYGLDRAPAVMFGSAGVLGLMAQGLSRRRLQSSEPQHRFWMRVLLLLSVVCAAANLAWPGTLVSLFPDYLVLAFFCVTLYYKERLIFFDLLIKRGAFFGTALVGLTLFFAFGSRFLDRLPSDWSRPWIMALLLLPFWLAGPWIYARLEQGIDRLWLRRRYSPADAERQFVREVQSAATEEDLRRRAGQSLEGIFQAPAEVLFENHPRLPSTESDGGMAAEIEADGNACGRLSLAARKNSIPYLSDDRRLLQSLARTLGVVLENVRFRQQRREQEEREQQLRWLASRAELKALRAQINPHFLFNALNAIAGLIPHQPKLADETVEQLAEVFRYTLRKSEKEWVRLDEEVEFVSSYLRVEQARFGDRLEIEIVIDPAAAAIPVPTMTIQPLIENAIKHGASVVEGRGRVRLCASLQGEALRVEVSDNGPGFPPGFSLRRGEAVPGHGLHNVMERLNGYFGDTAHLRWESTGGTTRVSIDIPVLVAERRR